MKVSIQTLGCKVNQSESASIEGVLRNNDYEIVDHSDNPDISIINTCTVTAKSDYQSRQLIRKAVKAGAKVIATGCYAQLKPEVISEIDGISAVLGNSDKDGLVDCLQNLSTENKPFIIVNPPEAKLKAAPYYSNRSRAFMKIQDGCNFSCTYCTVPRARGMSRSLCEHDIMLSMENLIKDGYREVVLTGIHIGSYGMELKPRSSLLKIVTQITDSYPEARIRLSSIEPQEFKMGFLKLIKEEKVCSHLHIPLQSGSDKILEAMNRRYSTETFRRLINNILAECPDISIGTDLITGFPGESDTDFDTTVNFIRSLPISYLHVFPYSQRPDTKASLMDRQISDQSKKIRVKKLLDISNELNYRYIKASLGATFNVIIEKKIKSNDFYSAISDNYLRIHVKAHSLISGQILKVKVISLTDGVLIAQPLK
ncbi:MAG: tRNA (N(6)-L-threonylcarbamoyladenosine(37)-C(2))-methylthiotransferase MtaB [Nitrospirota bacterium]